MKTLIVCCLLLFGSESWGQEKRFPDQFQIWRHILNAGMVDTTISGWRLHFYEHWYAYGYTEGVSSVHILITDSSYFYIWDYTSAWGNSDRDFMELNWVGRIPKDSGIVLLHVPLLDKTDKKE